MNRRYFTRLVSALPFATVLAQPAALPADAGETDRAYWLRTLLRIVDPVLTSLAKQELKARMPVESAPNQLASRKAVSHLEALGRSVAGLAPWLEQDTNAEERARQHRYRQIARQSIANAVNPASADYLNFTTGGQPLVDAAFLAQGLLRAPTQLWAELDKTTQGQVVTALQSTRVIKPGYNNWLLFSALIEAALLKLTGSGDELRMDYAIKQHLNWYKGDGVYGDGPNFHWDYYNSFVIQPMLLSVVGVLTDLGKADKALYPTLLARAQRYAAVQERLIGSDGSFPPLGRSLAYRCGAFQLLAQIAQQRQLPPDLTPGQVRNALTAVIRRTLDAPGTVDANGWLQIGLCGHQPALGETYISTGSLYLCTEAFLPLGLPSADPFWQSPPADWTARKVWSGQNVATDHALKE